MKELKNFLIRRAVFVILGKNEIGNKIIEFSEKRHQVRKTIIAKTCSVKKDLQVFFFLNCC